MDSMIRDIRGADRGFHTGADVLTHTADGVGLNLLWDEFSADLAAWNATRNAIAALFTSPTTESFVQLPNGGDRVEMEKQSEFGVPKASRVNPDYLRMGFPLDWIDGSIRYTRKFLRDATAEQVRAQHNAILEADNRLVFRETMSALTTKVTAGNRAVNENSVTIYDLWDGSSGEVPPSYAGKTFTDNHSHYLVSGAATVDGGDLKALIDTIQEHGYGLRSTPGDRIVIMVNPAEADVIWSFRRDPDDLAKDPYDFIPSVSAPAYLSPVDIVGDKAPAEFQGMAIEGSYGDAWITKNYFVPAGYVIAVAISAAGRTPLWLREHPNAGQRGLRLLPIYERYPLVESTYEHGFGVGVRHRSAAAVMQIKASGSYENPTWV